MERKEIIYHHENDVNENGQEVGCFRIKSSRLADCFIQLTDLSWSNILVWNPDYFWPIVTNFLFASFQYLDVSDLVAIDSDQANQRLSIITVTVSPIHSVKAVRTAQHLNALLWYAATLQAETKPGNSLRWSNFEEQKVDACPLAKTRDFDSSWWSSAQDMWDSSNSKVMMSNCHNCLCINFWGNWYFQSPLV